MTLAKLSGDSEVLCLECGRVFVHSNPWRATCGDSCRANRSLRRSRERESRRVRKPHEILAMRARCARWASEHKRCVQQKPWLAGVPPFEPHLPGFAQSIALDPLPRWPVDLRSVRALHGALTTLLGVGHGDRFPAFSLFPSSRGWAVHWYHHEAASLPYEMNGVLFDKPTIFRFGPRVRFKAPSGIARGRRLVSLEAVTPVVIANNGRETTYTTPTAKAIMGSLTTEYPNRIADAMPWTASAREQWSSWVRERARVDMVSSKTEIANIDVGSKYARVTGWTGRVDLEVNATARWLLALSERMGFGSRVGLGFGHIRVRDT